MTLLMRLDNNFHLEQRLLLDGVTLGVEDGASLQWPLGHRSQEAAGAKGGREEGRMRPWSPKSSCLSTPGPQHTQLTRQEVGFGSGCHARVGDSSQNQEIWGKPRTVGSEARKPKIRGFTPAVPDVLLQVA